MRHRYEAVPMQAHTKVDPKPEQSVTDQGYVLPHQEDDAERLNEFRWDQPFQNNDHR